MKEEDLIQSMAIDSLFESGVLGLGLADASQAVSMKRGALADGLVLNEPLCTHSPVLFGMQSELSAMKASERAKITIPRAAVMTRLEDSRKVSIHVIWDRKFNGYILLFHLNEPLQQEKAAIGQRRIQRIAEETLHGEAHGLTGKGALFGEIKKILTSASRLTRLEVAPAEADQNPLSRLTAREREVVKLVVSGYSNKVIAHELRISQKTVEAHRAHAVKRLGLKTSAELIRMAGEFGLQ